MLNILLLGSYIMAESLRGRHQLNSRQPMVKTPNQHTTSRLTSATPARPRVPVPTPAAPAPFFAASASFGARRQPKQKSAEAKINWHVTGWRRDYLRNQTR